MMTRCCLVVVLLAGLMASPLALRAADEDTEDDVSTTAADGVGDVRLIDRDGKKTTFSEAFGGGSKVVLVTKPWCDANMQIIGELKHYRIRLNKGGLRSGVVFLKSDRSDAIRAMQPHERKVRWFIDPDGSLARSLNVESMPSLALVDPQGQVRFSAPLLASDLVTQLARNFNRPDALFRRRGPKDAGLVKPGMPPVKGGLGRYSIR